MRNALDIRQDVRRITLNDALLIACMTGCTWWSAAGLIRLAAGG